MAYKVFLIVFSFDVLKTHRPWHITGIRQITFLSFSASRCHNGGLWKLGQKMVNHGLYGFKLSTEKAGGFFYLDGQSEKGDETI